MTYVPSAILFDGTTDYMLRGADLTGIADSKSGILSAWVRLDGGDGGQSEILSSDGIGLLMRRTGVNVFQVRLENSANSVIANMLSTTAFTSASSAYIHLLYSWDLAALTSFVYVNDVDDKASDSLVDDIIDYSQFDWAVGARPNGSNKLTGAISDIYFAPGQFLDFSVEANRRLFIDANGNPVYLGIDGSIPTGAVPSVYLRGVQTNQGLNSGDGGDFVSQGTQVPGETEGPVVDTIVTEPSTYVPSAILFDGTTDYMLRSADLIGNTDAKTGMVSFWFRLDGGNGSALTVLQCLSDSFRVRRQSGGAFQVFGRDASSVTILNISTVASYVAGAMWHHLLSSWDLAAGTTNLFVDDADDKSVTAAVDTPIDYTQTQWAVGGTTAGANLYNGALADLYFSLEYLDFSVVANRRKFIDASGNPVFLGGSGELPTGSSPAIYLRGNSQDQGDNSGIGGDFVPQGAQVPGETPGPVELIAQEQILSRRSDRYHRLHR